MSHKYYIYLFWQEWQAIEYNIFNIVFDVFYIYLFNFEWPQGFFFSFIETADWQIYWPIKV